jgi:hypothetical protein
MEIFKKSKQRIIPQNELDVKNESGQTLVEFLFLFIILIGLSFILIVSTNGRIAYRWTALIKVITSENPANAASKPVEIN